MPIYPGGNGGGRTKQFQIVTEGFHNLVLGAVQDLGIVDTTWGPKHGLRFVWVSSEVHDKTKEPLLVLQRLNNSLDERSELHKTLKAMAIGKFDRTTDLEKLVGTQITAVIVHKEARDGSRTYANIGHFLKLNSKQPKVSIPTGWKPPKVRTNTH
jgi:hypothetical protein